MTFREKLQQEHPQFLGSGFRGGCRGCPVNFGYESGYCGGECDGTDRSDEICRACWDREMPEKNGEEAVPHPSATPTPAPQGEGREVDMVNHPPHYTSGGIECIDAIAAALSVHKDPMSAWLTGQILKYCWRLPLKNGVEDLKKARFYLDRLIAREEKK